MNKSYKIFLASSEELKENRAALSNLVRQRNDNWQTKGISLKLVIWEDLSTAMSATRSQDDYNEEIPECDLFMVLFWTKVGKYTLEEFDKAVATFKAKGSPTIYVFQNIAPLPSSTSQEDLESKFSFEKKIKTHKYFHGKYDNTDALLRQVGDELDRFVNKELAKLSTPSSTISEIAPPIIKGKILGPQPFRPDLFIGRNKDLEHVRKTLTKADTNMLLLVNGQGGIGKTTLAARYFFKYRHQYANVAWVFAERSILDALFTLSLPLGIQYPHNSLLEQRLEILLQRIRELKRPSLLVVDNANNLKDLAQYIGVLQSFPNFHILLTTRVLEFKKAPMFRIRPLKVKDAKTLFKTHYPKHQASDDPLLQNIYEAVGKNTLVMELLAKNLHNLNRFRTNYSLADLLKDLQEKGLLSVKNSAVELQYQKFTIEKPEAVIGAMYDLGELSEEEKKLMANFAVLPAENIPHAHIAELLKDFEELDGLLLNLAKKGWLDYEAKDNSFKVSPVMQEVIKFKREDLLNDCNNLIYRLIEKLEYEGSIGHLINVTYSDAYYYAKYAENCLNSFETTSKNIVLLWRRLGKFFQTTGDIVQALKSFQAYNRKTQVLVKRNPSNHDFKNDYAISFYELGEINIFLGNLQEGLTAFENYSKFINELSLEVPEKSLYKSNLAISYEKLGETQSSLGNLEKALEYFEDQTELFEELYEGYPENVSFKNGLAISYSKLGSTQSSLGNLEKALEYFEKDAALTKELYEGYPENVSFKNGLAISYEKLGETQSSLGNLEKALEYFEERSRLGKELYEGYPENVSFKNGLAVSYWKLGDFYRSNEDRENALHYFKKCEKLLIELTQEAPEHKQFQENLAEITGDLENL